MNSAGLHWMRTAVAAVGQLSATRGPASTPVHDRRAVKPMGDRENYRQRVTWAFLPSGACAARAATDVLAACPL